MDLGDLTISELADLTEEEAWVGARTKPNEFPELRDIYDDVFLGQLIASRKTSTSGLLFRLVATDEPARLFWRAALDQMHAIGYARAHAVFAEKMRRDKEGNLQSWTAELRFAAWLMKQGIQITFDPPIGARKAEFLAATTPPTTWEIKTPADDAQQREEQRALRELHRLLRDLPTPIALSIGDFGEITFADVSAVVNEIKSRLARLELDRTAFPFEMDIDGLEVTVYRSDHERGYLGKYMTSMQELGDNHISRVAKIIRDAAKQLPPDGAGVIVIDASYAEWITKTSVVNACFGSDLIQLTVTRAAWPDRRANGVFNPKQNRRISAVLFWSDRFLYDDADSGVVAFYNPHAKIPLSDDWLPDETVRHGRLCGHLMRVLRNGVQPMTAAGV